MPRMTLGYVGLWHGGNGYSQGEWATDAEVFNSLEHAKAELWLRHRRSSSHGTRAVEWTEDGLPYAGNWLGNDMPGYFPAVGDDSELYLVSVKFANLDDLIREGTASATHVLTIGPRGGVTATKL